MDCALWEKPRNPPAPPGTTEHKRRGFLRNFWNRGIWQLHFLFAGEDQVFLVIRG